MNQASVLELRYAGRKLIEAHRHRVNGELDLSLSKLADAYYDTCRAQHDAIDAATSHMTSDLERIVKKVSPKIVAGLFPRYAELHVSLGKIRKKIQKSHLNREDRAATYDTIAAANLEETIDLFEAMRFSREIMLRQSALDKSAVYIVLAGWGLTVVLFLASPYWEKHVEKNRTSSSSIGSAKELQAIESSKLKPLAVPEKKN